MADEYPVAVLGAGTWGITLAALLAGKGRRVQAWDIAPEVIDQLARDGFPQRLPHLKLPDSLSVTTELGAALAGARTVLVVTPSHGVRGLCERLAGEGLLGEEAEIVLAAKGIEEETLALMTQIVEQVLGADAASRTAVLSGPSHAEEVSKGIPTAIVAAAEDQALAERVQDLFMTDRFRVYTQSDVVGVELAASLKNVIAIAAGACVGMGLGDNTLAALIARGLAEITRLGKRLGAHPETFAGLAGIGDLIVTAMSDHSRNRNFGRLMAEENLSPDEAQRSIGMVVEGVRTARAAHVLGRREGVPMPITDTVVQVLDGGLTVRDAVGALMEKDPKPEIYLTLDDLR